MGTDASSSDTPDRQPMSVGGGTGQTGTDGGGFKVGDQIGTYCLRELLGAGGMGAVWLAGQTGALHREVALKVIRPGADTAQMLERFREERQMLATLDHPNITRVYDAGETPDGRPYFVMEYVRGVPITKFCEERRLDLAGRLRLFARVCQAIHHAHQRGIIHRDVKPGNILVSDDEGEFRVKVIDFGIAKATDPSSRFQRGETIAGNVIGTPQYMSPEQAGGSNQLQPQSDVYCLGVVLYELLTGTTPLTPETLKKVALDEMLRVIKEEDASPPSTRLAQLRKTNPKAEPPGADQPRERITQIPQDLDWITMKALEKELGRRYETAAKFALDIERFLADEPVVARPPGLWYRSRRFVKRHRKEVAVAAAAGITTVLLVLTVAYWPEGPVPAQLGVERWIKSQTQVSGICTAPDGKKVYVAYRHKDGSIESYSLQSGQRLKEWTNPDILGLHGDVALSLDGKFIFTTEYYSTNADRIDTGSGEKVSFSLGGNPDSVWARGIWLTPDKDKLIVALGQDGRPQDEDNDQLSVFDVRGTNLSLVAEIKLRDEIFGNQAAFTPDGKFVYVVTMKRKSAGPRIYEVCLTPDCKVSRSYEFPPQAQLQGVALSPQTGKLFVSDATSRQVHVLRRETMRPERKGINLGEDVPGLLAVSPDGRTLHVACPEDKSLWSVSTEGKHRTAPVLRALAAYACDLEVLPDGSVCVAHNHAGILVATPEGADDREQLWTPKANDILYVSDRTGRQQVRVMRANGSEEVNLTASKRKAVSPRWSPDGQEIAMIAEGERGACIQIMKADGSDRRLLRATDPHWSSHRGVDWSPDQQQLAFIGASQTTIKLVDREGKNLRTLVSCPLRDAGGMEYGDIMSLVWSATNSILFIATVPGNGNLRALYQVDTRTGISAQIQGVRRTFEPRTGEFLIQFNPIAGIEFAPEYSRLYVVWTKPPEFLTAVLHALAYIDSDGDFVAMSEKGLLPQDVTGFQHRDGEKMVSHIDGLPSVSKGGNKLVFVRNLLGSSAPPQIWVRDVDDPDGRSEKQLTSGDSNCTQPDIR